MDEMRHDVSEKHSGEEANDVVIPVHDAFPLSAILHCFLIFNFVF
jgi:hypothetical protein